MRFSLPAQDVFAIDANAATPRLVRSHADVGAVLFNMTVNPISGKLNVSNTEAINEVRLEGEQRPGDPTATVQGRLQQSRITAIDGTRVLSRHLNKYINYALRPVPAGVRWNSLALPMPPATSPSAAAAPVGGCWTRRAGDCMC
ncbi:MAG: hypothetical protein ACT4QA_06335 [Panacagrimonas sp.]